MEKTRDLWIGYWKYFKCDNYYINERIEVYCIILRLRGVIAFRPLVRSFVRPYVNKNAFYQLKSSSLSVRPSVRPCTLLTQLLLNRLLDFYETLHICSTLPADVHEGIWLLSKI